MTLHPLLAALLPEIALVVAAVLVLLIGLSPRRGMRDSVPILVLVALGAALALTTWPPDSAAGNTPAVRSDALTQFVRQVVCVVGILIVLVNRHVPAQEDRGDYFSLLLLSLAGISLTSAADDLLLLFLALELVSVPTYVMIALSRKHEAVQEAACKYFFLGSFAAAITLYGFSFLYGLAGTTSMAGVGAKLLGAAPGDLLMRVALLLSLASLGFKVAAVPLHFYVPDVYQGAASPLSGALGFIPKMAGFVALMRILDMSGWRLDASMFWLLWVIAAATMTAGNTLALMQRSSVKRTLAYSSIAHTGYMFVALLAGPGEIGGQVESPMRNGLSALLFYMTVYAIMNLGAFSALAYFRSRRNGEPVETFEELAESARSNPWAALALAVCALGLMGLPPTAGLIGKMYLFSSALAVPEASPYHGPMLALVIIGVLNAAVGAAYYLRIASACALGERHSDVPAPTPCDALKVGIGASALLVLAMFVWPGPLTERARTAALSMQRMRVAPHAERAPEPVRSQPRLARQAR